MMEKYLYGEKEIHILPIYVQHSTEGRDGLKIPFLRAYYVCSSYETNYANERVDC